MALRFCDSFDHYATADLATKWNYTPNAVITAAAGRTASALNLSAGGSQALLSLDDQGTWIIGMASKFSQLPGGNTSLIVWSTTGIAAQIELWITGSGNWQVRRGATVLGTSTATMPIATWFYLEFKVLIHASAGSYDVRVDGVSVLSGAGANTSAVGNPDARFLQIVAALAAGTQYHDDLYICDATGSTNNNLLGDVTVKAVLPDGAGNYSQFTPSAGSNYQNVDDATPDGDTTYNGAADAGKKDSYNFAAVGLTGPVLGVQTVLTARKDIGGSKIVKDLVRIGSTDYSGSNQSLTDAYKMHRQIHELNPATSANWTIAQIDAAEFGVEVVS